MYDKNTFCMLKCSIEYGLLMRPLRFLHCVALLISILCICACIKSRIVILWDLINYMHCVVAILILPYAHCCLILINSILLYLQTVYCIYVQMETLHNQILLFRKPLLLSLALLNWITSSLSNVYSKRIGRRKQISVLTFLAGFDLVFVFFSTS